MMRLRLGPLLAGMLLASSVVAGNSGLAQEPATASPLDSWSAFIAEASRRFGISEAWIRAVMRAESGGQTMLDGRPITSHAGAMGLMQVMPETWVGLRSRYGLGVDPYDPHDNILAGAAYLRELYQRYGYPDLFAAYNAGPARFDEHLLTGRPLPDETRAYLASLGQPDSPLHPAPTVSSGTGLFFALHTIPSQTSNMTATSLSGGLFVALNRAAEREP